MNTMAQKQSRHQHNAVKTVRDSSDNNRQFLGVPSNEQSGLTSQRMIASNEKKLQIDTSGSAS